MADAPTAGVLEGAAGQGIDWRRLLANSALGLMGDTGSGKSTLAATIAEYTYKQFGKITRYYIADPGGFGDLLMSLIRLGIVEIWRMRTRDTSGGMGLPIGTMAQATQGCWPVERDPLTGDTRPGVALAPPYATQFALDCPGCGGVVRQAVRQAQLEGQHPCPGCGLQVSLATARGVRQAYLPIGGFDRVGCVVFDSGTGMCEWGMTDVNARAGRDELGGEKGAIRTQYSGGEIFGTAGRAGVGFIQNCAADWITNAIAIPGLVVPPVFTFRKDRGSDQAGLPIYGPQLVGTAKTSAVPGWLGNCFGVEGPASHPGNTYRVYLSQYALRDGVPNLVKHRAAAGTMPEYVEDPSGATLANGEAYQKFNLGYILELLLAAVEKTNKRADEMFPISPGLGTGKMEVPEGLVLKEGGPAAAGLPKGVGLPGVVVPQQLQPQPQQPAAAPAAVVVAPPAAPGPAAPFVVPPRAQVVVAPVPPAVGQPSPQPPLPMQPFVVPAQGGGGAPLPPAAGPRAAPRPPTVAPTARAKK